MSGVVGNREKRCSCCPYGFHIDVGFLKSLDKRDSQRGSLSGGGCNLRRHASDVGQKKVISTKPAQADEINDLKEATRDLSKYLDKLILPANKNNNNNKILKLNSNSNQIETKTSNSKQQQQQQPMRSLHRHNLVRSCGLTQLSSKSFSEDETRKKFLKNLLTADHLNGCKEIREEEEDDDEEEKIAEVSSQRGKSSVVLLNELGNKEEMILTLKQKINALQSERGRLLRELCERCKPLLDVGGANLLKHNHSRSYSGNSKNSEFSVPLVNLNSPLKSSSSLGGLRVIGKGRSPTSPGNFPEKSQTSGFTRIPEFVPQTNGIVHSKEPESNSNSNPNPVKPTKSSNVVHKITIRPKSAAVKIASMFPVKSTETSVVSGNQVQVSKLRSPQFRAGDSQVVCKVTQAKPFGHAPSNREACGNGSKVHCSHTNFISKNKLAVKTQTSVEKPVHAALATRSNSMDESEDSRRSHLQDLILTKDCSSSDENIRGDGPAVSGRRGTRRSCGRSLSLLATPVVRNPTNRYPADFSNSDEDEEMTRDWNSDHTDDQSSTSFDEGAYDGELGQIIFKQKLTDPSN